MQSAFAVSGELRQGQWRAVEELLRQERDLRLLGRPVLDTDGVASYRRRYETAGHVTAPSAVAGTKAAIKMTAQPNATQRNATQSPNAFRRQ